MNDERHDKYHYIIVEKRDKPKFESKVSIILAVLSFGIYFSLYFGSWALYFCMGPFLWVVAILFGVIAVLKEDDYGYVGIGLAYLSFLGHVSFLFM